MKIREIILNNVSIPAVQKTKKKSKDLPCFSVGNCGVDTQCEHIEMKIRNNILADWSEGREVLVPDVFLLRKRQSGLPFFVIPDEGELKSDFWIGIFRTPAFLNGRTYHRGEQKEIFLEKAKDVEVLAHGIVAKRGIGVTGFADQWILKMPYDYKFSIKIRQKNHNQNQLFFGNWRMDEDSPIILPNAEWEQQVD